MTDQKIDKTHDQSVRSRRAFLKGAGVASVAAAVSVVVSDEAEATSVEAKDASGYQETEHVSSYYKAAKF